MVCLSVEGRWCALIRLEGEWCALKQRENVCFREGVVCFE